MLRPICQKFPHFSHRRLDVLNVVNVGDAALQVSSTTSSLDVEPKVTAVVSQVPHFAGCINTSETRYIKGHVFSEATVTAAVSIRGLCFLADVTDN